MLTFRIPEWKNLVRTAKDHTIHILNWLADSYFLLTDSVRSQDDTMECVLHIEAALPSEVRKSRINKFKFKFNLN